MKPILGFVALLGLQILKSVFILVVLYYTAIAKSSYNMLLGSYGKNYGCNSRN